MSLQTEPSYGIVEHVSDHVRRIIAPNPSALTEAGTNSYLVGRGSVALIDPGPHNDEHIAAILRALRGETLAAILIAHTDHDHSGSAPALQAATGAPTYGLGPHVSGQSSSVTRSQLEPRSGWDMAFVPDHRLCDGNITSGGNWSLEAVWTPGHASNHLCFALLGTGILFSGDHVMGWSTTSISPPDGDLLAYINSLRKLLDRSETIYLPGHGSVIDDGKLRSRKLLKRRLERRREIAGCVVAGSTSTDDLLSKLYGNLRPELVPLARLILFLHLVELEKSKVLEFFGEPSPDTRFAAKIARLSALPSI